MNKERIKQIVFGIVLGVAIGLLFDSLLLLATTGWIVIFIIPVLFPILLFAGFFGVLGNKEKLPVVPWWCILLIVLIGWTAALSGPIRLQEIRFRSIADKEIPVYNNAKEVSTSIVTVPGDGGRWIAIKSISNTNYLEVADFYRKELPGYGWDISKDRTIINDKWSKNMVLIYVKKPKRTLEVRAIDERHYKQGAQEQFTTIETTLSFK